ncbi:MAG: radical SAM protein [Draconibacterium sp.]
MDPFNAYLNDLVNRNKKEFAEFSDIKWLNPYVAAKAEQKKLKLTQNLNNNWLFKNTKPFYNHISPGCQICGQGKWSCLFITGKCNGGCFYCPTSQLNDELPTSQNLHFETAEAYAEYINHFKFKGVSFSGGEPLLFFDRTLEYLKEIRKSCSPDIYIWMYTNGILADSEKFEKLAEAGLNEIRFDIGATNYKLDKIQFAKGLIPNITIEIPAVPEKKGIIKQLLPEMINAGVTNLNLHQLRLTKHNAPKLLKHDYTYIHAEQPIVLESELAALEILNFAKDHNLSIGINYCSFFFKNRFQKAGFRNQVAGILAAPNSIITEKGFIRKKTTDTIAYNTITISDDEKPNSSYLQLKHKTYFFKEETALKSQVIAEEDKTELEDFLANGSYEIPADPLLFKIWQMEYIEKGLREY